MDYTRNGIQTYGNIITDYFTSPEGARDSKSDEDDDEFDNGQMKLQGTAKLNAISTDIISYRV